MNKKIFRILSYEFFRDLINRQSLAFATYDTWEDPNEGKVLRAICTQDGQKRVLDHLQKSNKSDVDPKIVIDLLFWLRYSLHMQSWTKTEESDAMWRGYAGNGDGVQISTTLDHVKMIGGIEAINIKYEEQDLKSSVERLVQGNKIKMTEAFRYKNKAFSHENEVRLITSVDLIRGANFHNQGGLNPAIVRGLLGKMVDQGDLNLGDVRTVMRQFVPNWLNYVSFGHVPGFIQSVRVNPFAMTKYVDEVEAYCVKNGITFLGKSKLYTTSANA